MAIVECKRFNPLIQAVVWIQEAHDKPLKVAAVSHPMHWGGDLPQGAPPPQYSFPPYSRHTGWLNFGLFPNDLGVDAQRVTGIFALIFRVFPIPVPPLPGG